MKTYFLWRIATTLFLALFVLTLSACKSKKKHALGILIDDSSGCELRSMISVPGIRHTFMVNEDVSTDDGFEVHLSRVTGVSLNAVSHLALPMAGSFDNPENRSEQVDSFFIRLDSLIQDTSHGCKVSKSTFLYSAIKQMAGILIQDTSSKYKTLIVATDGLENNKQVSFLKGNQYTKDRLSLATKLKDSFGELPDLSGVLVILVFQPEEGSKHGIKPLLFWEDLLLSLGASVKLQANI